MKKFVSGLLIGVGVGVAIPVSAATLVGSTGYLFGWSVTVKGREICDSPYVWVSLREIDC